eukprot:COSAG06_NODE_61049_length_269_cov_0.576471_1_plen_25_part_10
MLRFVAVVKELRFKDDDDGGRMRQF